MLPRGPFSNATQDYEQVAGSRLLVNLAKSLLTHGLGSPSQGGPQANNTGLVVTPYSGDETVEQLIQALLRCFDPSARTMQNAKGSTDLCCLGRCQTVVSARSAEFCCRLDTHFLGTK